MTRCGERVDHFAVRHRHYRHILQLAADDRTAQLQLGRLDIRHQARGPAAGKRGSKPSSAWGARSAAITSRLPDDMNSLTVWKNSCLRGVLAADELQVVDHQQVDRAQPRLERVGVLVAQRLQIRT